MPFIQIFISEDLSSAQLRGLKIFLARRAKKMSLEEMAKEMRRSDDTLRRWEKGVVCPDLDEARAIARVLGQPKGFLD
ncbi:MAG: helix-turn-helix domain-containing protein [Microcoleus sp.]